MQGEEFLVVFIIYLGGAFLIAHFLGSKRKIGFGWSFFFSIFPNPANEIFYIEQKAATSQSTLRIFDITGKIILTAPLTETIMKIDISKLPGGLYTISVSNEATIFYDQLIIGK